MSERIFSRSFFYFTLYVDNPYLALSADAELARKLDNKRVTDAAAVLAKDATVMEKL